MTVAAKRPLLTLLSALLLAGCIASEGPASTLSASSGSGSFVIYMVLDHGTLTRSDVWWAEQAPELDLHVSETPGWEGIVLKNDVAVDRVPLKGTFERAFLHWNSGAAGVMAGAGDHFEVIVLNGTSQDTVATFALDISP